MHNFFAPSQRPNPDSISQPEAASTDNIEEELSPEERAWFSSDDETDENQGGEADDEWEEDKHTLQQKKRTALASELVPNMPGCDCLQATLPRKRRWHDVPIRVLCERKHEEMKKELEEALLAIEQLLQSKKTQFVGGPNGLQAYHAWAIQSYLIMVVKCGRLSVDASERAAEGQGFAAKWGGRSSCLWTGAWIKE
jgi:hypothetical protein